jgi:hypothetical protein
MELNEQNNENTFKSVLMAGKPAELLIEDIGSILYRLPKSPVFEIEDNKLPFLVDDAVAFAGRW